MKKTEKIRLHQNEIWNEMWVYEGGHPLKYKLAQVFISKNIAYNTINSRTSFHIYKDRENCNCFERSRFVFLFVTKTDIKMSVLCRFKFAYFIQYDRENESKMIERLTFIMFLCTGNEKKNCLYSNVFFFVNNLNVLLGKGYWNLKKSIYLKNHRKNKNCEINYFKGMSTASISLSSLCPVPLSLSFYKSGLKNLFFSKYLDKKKINYVLLFFSTVGLSIY